MKKISCILLPLLFVGCQKLDDVAFPRDNSITEYLFDNYEGESELELTEAYNVPTATINRFTAESLMEDEIESKTIEFVYIGNLATITFDTVIVYCHGQSNHMDYYWTRAKLLASCGGINRFGVLMMDYRGYGLSEGEPSEDGLHADVGACLGWLENQGVTSDKVIMYGFSLGSVPASEAAAYYDSYKPAALILESPIASAANLSEESTVINFSPAFVSTLEFDNVANIQDVDQPLLWMHGTADDYVAISNGELIYANHNGSYKEAHRVEGALHGKDGVPHTMGLDEYLQVVEDFITR